MSPDRRHDTLVRPRDRMENWSLSAGTQSADRCLTEPMTSPSLPLPANRRVKRPQRAPVTTPANHGADSAWLRPQRRDRSGPEAPKPVTKATILHRTNLPLQKSKASNSNSTSPGPSWTTQDVASTGRTCSSLVTQKRRRMNVVGSSACNSERGALQMTPRRAAVAFQSRTESPPPAASADTRAIIQLEARGSARALLLARRGAGSLNGSRALTPSGRPVVRHPELPRGRRKLPIERQTVHVVQGVMVRGANRFG